MLRFVLAICLIANIAYAAWAAGALAFMGAAPHNPSEPWRLHRQIRGEALTIVAEKSQQNPPTHLSSENKDNAEKPAPKEKAENIEKTTTAAASNKTENSPPAQKPAPSEKSDKSAQTDKPAQSDKPEKSICLQAGPFDPPHIPTLRTALARAGLTEQDWTLTEAPQPGRWMVYIGPLPTSAEAAARATAIAKTGLEAASVTGAFAPGVSLGRFSTPEGARTRLAAAAAQGIAGARVVVEREPGPGYTLRLPRVTAALQPRVNALRPALAGRAMRNCVAGKS